MARKRRPHCRGINIHRTYSVDETARAFRVAKGTVRRWLKRGLPALKDQKPLLILGADLAAFASKSAKPRQTCKPHECFCVKCRAPQIPAGDMAEFLALPAKGGNLRAICPGCGKLMHKRVALRNLEPLRQFLDLTIVHAPARLTEMNKPSPNDHLPKERTYHG